MAIAVITQEALIKLAKEIEFPMDHRINLTKGGVGYDLFNRFIKENLLWINELDFDKDLHVKLWGSAKVTGPVPLPESYYSRSVFTGTTEENPFKQFAETGESPAHANYIGATFALAQDYIADYVESEDGQVAVVEYIRVIVGTKTTDSFLGYGLEIPVLKLWKQHFLTDGKTRFWVERSAHNADLLFEGDEHYYVREQTQAEVDKGYHFNETTQLWVANKHEPSIQVADVAIHSPMELNLNGFSDTEDSYAKSVRRI